MTRTYDEIVGPLLDDTVEARDRRAVLEGAYTLAMQVIALREKHGLTQVELARRSGVNQADISRIERGAVHPTSRTLQRIADALGADVRLVERLTA